MKAVWSIKMFLLVCSDAVDKEEQETWILSECDTLLHMWLEEIFNQLNSCDEHPRCEDNTADLMSCIFESSFVNANSKINTLFASPKCSHPSIYPANLRLKQYKNLLGNISLFSGRRRCWCTEIEIFSEKIISVSVEHAKMNYLVKQFLRVNQQNFNELIISCLR